MQDNELPAYARVKADIRKSIRLGKLSPGEQIPTQHELSQKFGVSRITIVRALQDLERDGLVERRQGVGTFVSNIGTKNSLTNVSLLYKQTFEAVERPLHRLLVVNEGQFDGGRAGNVLGRDVPLWYVLRLRIRGDQAVSHEESFIPLSRVPPGLSPAMLENMLLHDFLTQECGIALSSTRVYIEATLLDEEQSRLLRCTTNDPGLLITRVTYGTDGRPVSLSLNTLPADLSSYYFDFRHDDAPQADTRSPAEAELGGS